MTRLSVPDMSCGHCTAAIEKAIKAIDPTARVSCDLGAHIVEVESFLGSKPVDSIDLTQQIRFILPNQ